VADSLCLPFSMSAHAHSAHSSQIGKHLKLFFTQQLGPCCCSGLSQGHWLHFNPAPDFRPSGSADPCLSIAVVQAAQDPPLHPRRCCSRSSRGWPKPSAQAGEHDDFSCPLKGRVAMNLYYIVLQSVNCEPPSVQCAVTGYCFLL
jgi:hypothetical protein